MRGSVGAFARTRQRELTEQRRNRHAHHGEHQPVVSEAEDRSCWSRGAFSSSLLE